MSMKKIKKYICLLLAVLAGGVVQSCKETIDTSDRYTFTQETIASYLEKHENYSAYYKLLGEVPISSRSTSTVLQLMSARGRYTVFAPSNAAVQAYLDSLVVKGIISEPKWEAFTDAKVLDSIRKVIVYNSIIDSGDEVDAYQTSSFPQDTEEFLQANMNDRKLSVNYGTNPDSMYINGTKDSTGNVLNGCLVDLRNRDVRAINGYLHQVHSVVAPSNETLGDLFRGFLDSGEGDYVVTAKVILACGLQNELSKVKDEVYEAAYLEGSITNLPTHPSFRSSPGYLPEHRKYGYTVFAETDDFWRNAIGKDPKDISVEDVKNWVISQGLYPDALDNGNYADEKNVLNQFMTYHILPMRLPVDKLVIHYNEKGYYYATSKAYTIPTWEIYTTLGERRLLKIYQSRDVEGIFLNRFPNLDNGRRGTYRETSCDMDKQGFRVETDKAQSVVNGYIYPITAMGGGTLAYTPETRTNFQRQRLRFDVAGLFPELMNNDIRANRVSKKENLCVGVPVSSTYPYLENLDIADGTNFYYLLGLGEGWQNYQGDEFNVVGRYEMTFRLPPVPVKGTYEIRYAVQNNSGLRGMCQVYFGTNKDNLYAMGIPLDLRIGGNGFRSESGIDNTYSIGWEADSNTDDDYNAEVDKKMRNNSFMKGPEHYHAGTASSSTARATNTTTRRIIVREEMEPGKTYYLKFKSVLDDEKKEFYMDYIEFCAKEVYDNPQTPEDIW